MRFYQPLIDSAPATTSSLTRTRIARAYHELGRITEAIPHYEKALELDVQHQKIATELAVLCHSVGNKEKTEYYTTQALAYYKYSTWKSQEREKAAMDGELSSANPLAKVSNNESSSKYQLASDASVTKDRVEQDPTALRSILAAPEVKASDTAAGAQGAPTIKILKGEQFGTPAVLIHLKMQLMQEDIDARKEDVISEWLEDAGHILSSFASVSAFFPKDRGRHPRFKNQQTSTEVIDLDTDEEDVVDSIEIGMSPDQMASAAGKSAAVASYY